MSSMMFIALLLLVGVSGVDSTSSKTPLSTSSVYSQREPLGPEFQYCFYDAADEQDFYVEWAVDSVETEAYDTNTYYAGQAYRDGALIGVVYGYKRYRRTITLVVDEYHTENPGNLMVFFFEFDPETEEYRRDFKFHGATSFDDQESSPMLLGYHTTMLVEKEGCWGMPIEDTTEDDTTGGETGDETGDDTTGDETGDDTTGDTTGASTGVVDPVEEQEAVVLELFPEEMQDCCFFDYGSEIHIDTASELFSQDPADTPCTLIDVEAEFEAWIEQFGLAEGSQGYFHDPDFDRLCNLQEFYLETNPSLLDTDLDLLEDGYEFRVGLDPLQFQSSSEDLDSDGLDNLNEQIIGCSALMADTDGDGVNDGDEVAQGSDPNSDADGGAAITNGVTVELTIGDPSGSHSERYTLTVGPLSHSSPDFGVVGSGQYPIGQGIFPISIRHDASNLDQPDYDYFAGVEVVSSGAGIVTSIEDPENILGSHNLNQQPSFPNAGKTATLFVNSSCSSSSSCDSCVRSDGCWWSTKTKSCQELPLSFFNTVWSFRTEAVTEPEECPCNSCRAWLTEDEELARRLGEERGEEFPGGLPDCPCTVNLEEVPEGWHNDLNCKLGKEGCTAHPGSMGCIRSYNSLLPSYNTAGQQCCYDPAGVLITDFPAGGTPDLYQGLIGHPQHDYLPFKDCCELCEEADACDIYGQRRPPNDPGCN